MNIRFCFGLAVFAWLLLGVAAFAGDAVTNAGPNVAALTNGPTGETNALAPFQPAEGVIPSTKEEFWRFAISVITLGLLQLVKKIPALPNWVLPILAPGVGILLGAGLRALGQLNLGWVDMAAMGGLATWIHQLASQVALRQSNPEIAKT